MGERGGKKGQGEGRRGRTRKLEGEKRKKERQKDEDESVGEMMGIKKRNGAGQSWTKLNIVGFIIGNKRTLIHQTETGCR